MLVYGCVSLCCLLNILFDNFNRTLVLIGLLVFDTTLMLELDLILIVAVRANHKNIGLDLALVK